MLAEQSVAPASLSRKQAPGHLGSPSAPLRELPSMAGTGQERGRRKPPGTRESRALRSGPRSTVPRLRDATCGAPGGVRADRKARGTSARCLTMMVRLSALRSLTHVREKEKKAPPQRHTIFGADESRLQGCLKIESEN